MSIPCFEKWVIKRNNQLTLNGFHQLIWKLYQCKASLSGEAVKQHGSMSIPCAERWVIKKNNQLTLNGFLSTRWETLV